MRTRGWTPTPIPIPDPARHPDALSFERATKEVVRGRLRASEVATRLGIALREARLAGSITQAQAASRVRISQVRWSELERGLAPNAPLETWALAATAVGRELVAFLDRGSGASLPRDIEHLRRQSAIVERARAGGWVAAAEMPVMRGDVGRVIDVLLARQARREAIVVEVWDLLLDVGAAFRSFDEKIAAVGALRPGWTVSGAWVLRGTRRNRAVVAELRPLFGARFGADGGATLRAFTDAGASPPREHALLWTAVGDTALTAWRPGRGRR